MTEKEFTRKVNGDQGRFLDRFFDLLEEEKIAYCLIGGLAVNAYADPVVSLDVDVVVLMEKEKSFLTFVQKELGCSVEQFPHSVNLFHPDSDVRIQIQRDERFQGFMGRSQRKTVLEREIPVASLEDLVRSKVWAALDSQCRASKRQKDILDLQRLLEVQPEVNLLIPEKIKAYFVR